MCKDASNRQSQKIFSTHPIQLANSLMFFAHKPFLAAQNSGYTKPSQIVVATREPLRSFFVSCPFSRRVDTFLLQLTLLKTSHILNNMLDSSRYYRIFLGFLFWTSSLHKQANGFASGQFRRHPLPNFILLQSSQTRRFILRSTLNNDHTVKSQPLSHSDQVISNATTLSESQLRTHETRWNVRAALAQGVPDTDIGPPRRPLVRLIDNIWYVMCTPFPDLRKLSRKRDLDSKHVVSIRLRDGFMAVFAYLALGVISYRYIFEKWSFVDALYFSCVTFSTVGYGDIYPHTVAGKFFCCLFGISGIALLGAAVARIGSRLVEAEINAVKTARKQSQRRLLQIYDKMPKAVMALRRSSHKNHNKVLQEARELLASIPHPHFPPFITTFWNAARYIIQSLCIVAAGGLFIGYLEGWTWYDSLYYGLMTGRSKLLCCTRLRWPVLSP